MTHEDLDLFFTAGGTRTTSTVLMTFMAEDCVFESASGSEVCGTRHVGRARVRERVRPDLHDLSGRTLRRCATCRGR
jgi:hypothetical protein